MFIESIRYLYFNSMSFTAPTMKMFRADTVTANSVKLKWSQVGSNVAVFSLTHFINDSESLSDLAQFPIKVKDGAVLPYEYEKLVSGLSSCTKFMFILRSHNKEGCGIAEVAPITVITKASSEFVILYGL